MLQALVAAGRLWRLPLTRPIGWAWIAGAGVVGGALAVAPGTGPLHLAQAALVAACGAIAIALVVLPSLGPLGGRLPGPRRWTLEASVQLSWVGLSEALVLGPSLAKGASLAAGSTLLDIGLVAAAGAAIAATPSRGSTRFALLLGVAWWVPSL